WELISSYRISDSTKQFRSVRRSAEQVPTASDGCDLRLNSVGAIDGSADALASVDRSGLEPRIGPLVSDDFARSVWNRSAHVSRHAYRKNSNTDREYFRSPTGPRWTSSGRWIRMGFLRSGGTPARAAAGTAAPC